MKIIVSPSKTQKPDYNTYFKAKELVFEKQHKRVLAMLRKQSKKDIASKMKIKGDLLDITYKNIKNYNENRPFQAFYSFDGLVFKNLQKDMYHKEENEYIQNHVVILDAFYGVIEPGTMIKPYRLDMKMNFGINLYKHWDVDTFFNGEIILNLASDEYSKMINKDMITVSFLQHKNGTYVNQATYSKMARGMFLNYMILNKITEINDLKAFNQDGYQFNQDLSTDSLFIFTR